MILEDQLQFLECYLFVSQLLFLGAYLKLYSIERMNFIGSNHLRKVQSYSIRNGFGTSNKAYILVGLTILGHKRIIQHWKNFLKTNHHT